jgi:hypothetical protein
MDDFLFTANCSDFRGAVEQRNPLLDALRSHVLFRRDPEDGRAKAL